MADFGCGPDCPCQYPGSRENPMEQGKESASLSSRVSVWGKAVEMIKDYPLVGIGPGTFAFIYTQYQPPGLILHFDRAHNDYLHFIS